MIKVLSRSNAESTKEAVSDIEEEYNTATALAATKRILTIVLTDISSAMNLTRLEVKCLLPLDGREISSE
jgi:hypothetical protein